jgi:hypothetical protein
MVDVDLIDGAEEKALLRAWFETTQFDDPSSGIPALKPEDDDEEDRNLWDAWRIEEWVRGEPGEPVPRDALANRAAWALVDESALMGLSKIEAEQLMVTVARRHLSGQHPQKSHGGGGGGSSGGVSGTEAEAALREGKNVTVARDAVGPLMAKMAKTPPPVNLAKLNVEGEPCCFQKHLRDIPRADMPQLPTNVEGLKPFAAKLAAKGVKADLVEVDPRTLRATQSELNSQKVGKLAGFMTADGWQKGGVLIVSKEGAILDGHHRWAGASVAAMSGQKIKVTALRVDMGIDDLLKIAQESSGPRMAMEAGLAA